LRHIGKAHATWFGQLVLAVASGLPPYLKGRRENTRSTSSHVQTWWSEDAGHEAGK